MGRLRDFSELKSPWLHSCIVSYKRAPLIKNPKIDFHVLFLWNISSMQYWAFSMLFLITKTWNEYQTIGQIICQWNAVSFIEKHRGNSKFSNQLSKKGKLNGLSYLYYLLKPQLLLLPEARLIPNLIYLGCFKFWSSIFHRFDAFSTQR